MCGWNSSFSRISGRSFATVKPPAQLAVVTPHEVQQENALAPDRVRERAERLGLGRTARGRGAPRLELAQAPQDGAEGLALPLDHRAALDGERVEVAVEGGDRARVVPLAHEELAERVRWP